MTGDDELVASVADVLLNAGCGTTTECEAIARAALAVAEPVIRERCARDVERANPWRLPSKGAPYVRMAARIRTGATP